MQPLMLIFHMLIAFILIVLILLQHGKGADMGASFGSGASQTLFGSQGSLPFLVKVTGILAALFFASSLLLGYMTAQAAKQAAFSNLPSILKSNTTISQPINIPVIPNSTGNNTQQNIIGNSLQQSGTGNSSQQIPKTKNK